MLLGWCDGNKHKRERWNGRQLQQAARTWSIAMTVAGESSVSTEARYIKSLSPFQKPSKGNFSLHHLITTTKKIPPPNPPLDISFLFLQLLLLVNGRCSLLLPLEWEEREKLRWQIKVYQSMEYFKEKHRTTDNYLLFLRGDGSRPSHVGWKSEKQLWLL